GGLYWLKQCATTASECRVLKLLVHDQERAETVEVVDVAFAPEIVGKICDVGALADVDEVGLTVLIERDFRQYAVIATVHIRSIFLWYVTAIDSHCRDVGVHARARSLEPVVGVVPLIDDLIPESGLLVLVTGPRFNE